MSTSEDHALPYQQMFSRNRAVMLLINPDDGRVVDASLGACEYYGYSLSEITAMSIFDINTMSRTEIVAEMQRARDMHKNHFNFQHRIASGEVRDVEVISNPIPMEDRTFLYSVIHDVTVRKQSETALLESEEKYRLLIENSPAIVYSFSDQTGGLYYSPRVMDVLGYSAEYLGEHSMLWHDSIHAEDLAMVDEAIAALKDGVSFELEYRIRHVNGGWLWLHDRNIVIQEKQDERIIYGLALDITEKKRAEFALWESEENYRLLINGIPDILYRTDMDGRITYITPSVQKLCGYTQEEAIGLRLTEDIYAEPGERKYLLEALQKSEFVENFEAKLKRKDGSIWWGSANVHLLKGRDGVLLGGVEGVVRDISDRKNMEIELIQHRHHLEELVEQRTDELARARDVAESSQQMLQTVLDAIPVRVFWKDTDLNYFGCNRLFAQDAGFSKPEELLGLDDFDMGWKREAELYRSDDRSVMESDKPLLAYEELQTTPDGNQIWLSTSKIPLEDSNGRIIGILGTYEDITRRKVTEAKLVESETSFRTLIEVSSDAIMLLDEKGFFDCNPATLELFGCADVKSFSFLHPSELSPPTQPDGKPSAQAAQQHIEQAFREGNNFFEWKHWRYDDHREFSAEVLLNAIKLGERNVLQAVVRDITERKRAEHSIIESMEAAEAATKTKSEFLANMSHEIRTPLNAVLGLANIGLRDSKEKESRENFSHIIDSGEHLLGVINDILDFSRIEEGKLTIESRPLQLITSVENITGMMAERAQVRGLMLKLNFDSNMPAWVEGDPLRLQQILLNLLSNAIKFTRQGEVSLSVARDGDMTHFRVSDSGIGMGKKEISRLFNPFEQADSSTTRKYGGSGLGLSISQNLAELMNGRIDVESQAGAGSVFTLSMPLPVTQSPAIKKKATPGETGVQLSGLRILAAEDVEINRIILEDLLEQEGAHVVFAENGQQALDRLKEEGVSSFDLVLMDVQMPVMDGYEATLQIREMASGLPIIGLTAHALEAERGKCLAVGMVDHVTKPIDPDILITAILSCV